MSTKLDLNIVQGKTFNQVVRWETDVISYAGITAITQAAPAQITAPSHGLPDGWSVTVVSVKGMTGINAQNDPPQTSDYVRATKLDANTIKLNTVNAALYKPYTSGGYVQYYTPHALASYTARMTIKDRVGGTVLETLTSGSGNITVDDANKAITLTLDAFTTAAYTWKKGVYDLELVSPDVTPIVTLLIYGAVSLTKEVTT